MTDIGESAFAFTKLKNITLPEGIKSVSADAFEGCDMDSVTFNGMPDADKCTYAFRGAQIKNIILNTATVTKAVSQAFDGIQSYSAVTFTGKVTEIGDYAFSNCKFITAINIPNGVTKIGNNTFENCCELKTANIANSVTSIGSNAFFGCTVLESVTLSTGITELSDNIFGECSNLKNFTIPENIKVIGAGALWGIGTKSLTIPSSVEEIKGNAVAGVEEVVIEPGVKKIGENAIACESTTFLGTEEELKKIDFADNNDFSKIHSGTVIDGKVVNVSIIVTENMHPFIREQRLHSLPMSKTATIQKLSGIKTAKRSVPVKNAQSK